MMPHSRRLDLELQCGEANLAALRAENARLREAAQAAFDYIGMSRFEPDPGQPHPLRDGAYDLALDKLRAALAPNPSPAR